MSIGLLTAFLGGALALLSPCAALLLPAFFASQVGTRGRLVLHGLVFYAGLLLVLVPLGVGAGALGAAFVQHREIIIGVASAVMIALGLAQAWGLGFDPARLLPGAGRLQADASSATGLLKSLLLGSVSAIAGFCAGPILGAVLTLAAAQGDMVGAGILLAAYGAGMVVPLILIAAGWERLGDRGRARLRGRAFRLWGRDWHTTSVITGAILVAAGALLWTTNGLLGVPELLPLEAQAWLQGRLQALASRAVDVVVIVLVAALAIVAWSRWSRRGRTDVESSDVQPADDGAHP